ncbi:unnamed protein product, partial [Discosporangium mesarthrocarpum]
MGPGMGGAGGEVAYEELVDSPASGGGGATRNNALNSFTNSEDTGRGQGQWGRGGAQWATVASLSSGGGGGGLRRFSAEGSQGYMPGAMPFVAARSFTDDE